MTGAAAWAAQETGAADQEINMRKAVTSTTKKARGIASVCEDMLTSSQLDRINELFYFIRSRRPVALLKQVPHG
jgi:hypothetical protein